MHDEPHVGSIDAHAESHGRDDDVGALAEKRVLMAAALHIRQPGVIGECGMADLAQPRGERIHLAARRAVHDAGFTAMARQHLESCFFSAARGSAR